MSEKIPNIEIRPFKKIKNTRYILGFVFILNVFNINILSTNLGGFIGSMIDVGIPLLGTIWCFIIYNKKILIFDDGIDLSGMYKNTEYISFDEIISWSFSGIKDELVFQLKSTQTTVKTQYDSELIQKLNQILADKKLDS